jgi:hypothetical protein
MNYCINSDDEYNFDKCMSLLYKILAGIFILLLLCCILICTRKCISKENLLIDHSEV